MRYLNLLENMFVDVTENKHSMMIEHYYHPDFVMYANGFEQSFKDFLDSHKKIHETSLQYKVEIDADASFESDEKAAMRVFIMLSAPGCEPQKIEVILIASFKDNKIFRLWETTHPDWSKMDHFINYGK